MGGRTGVRQVYMFSVGWEELPKSCSVYGADPSERLREPVPIVLLETVDGWFLLDTGLNKVLIEDPALYRRFHSRFHSIKPILPKYNEDPLVDALYKVGLGVSDISGVAISHLHNDHSGGIRHFAGGTPVFIQKQELEFGLGNQVKCESDGYARVDYDDPSVNWVQLEGDGQVAPGVDAIFTPGHTPGHMSFVVHFEGEDSSGMVFACDAGDLHENFEAEMAIGGFIDVEPRQTIEQIVKLKQISKSYNYELIPGHDPTVWPGSNENLMRKVH